MADEKHTKEMYDKFGKEYQKTRKEKHQSRLYNEYLEVPCMIKAVGNIKGKKLLDIGCGAGIHIKKYISKGAICWGSDISKSMIEMAKENCPDVKFEVASMTKLPYKNSSFDIVTASLSIHYIKNLVPVFKEISRVLKKGGKFYYSTESPTACARERYEDKNFSIVGVGKFIDKKTGKQITLGKAWDEVLTEWEMVPGMIIETYKKTFRTQLSNLRDTGFELIDFIDCKPTPTFKKYDPKGYEVYSKFPVFSIYVSQKK
jgi:ubiquinone/menaquinone biosynthesis C-methylase UbiE